MMLMFEMGQKVKYVGHLHGCTSCQGEVPTLAWADRIGSTAVFIGTPGRADPETVKIHFDGEAGPCFVYLAHLDKA
jgi:hypothetical protein